MKRCACILVIALASCNSPTLGGGAAQTYLLRPIAVAGAPTRFFVRGGHIELAVGNGPAVPFFIKGVDYMPTPICKNYIETPLANANSAIWKRDLPRLRALGVNAIKVYNSNANASVANFLKAAYNGGRNPIYTILSIRFNPDVPLNSGAVADVSSQYKKLAQVNGANPDVIGISIGSEVNSEKYRSNQQWWAGMTAIANAAKDGFRLAGHAEKIVTTTMVDDGFITERQGEQYGFPVDAWGINFYRGKTFGKAFSEYRAVSSKPLIASEWGTPEAWHPRNTWNVVTEFPQGKVPLLTGYVSGLAAELYANYKAKGAVAGGFYFEYNDEWYKAARGNPCKHLAGPKANPNPNFPSGWNDEGWYGLNRDAPGTPNVLAQRPTFLALKRAFAKQ